MLDDRPGWSVRFRVWIDFDGVKVLGPGRVELLELIDRHKSISKAAKEMGMSYRRAWSLVQQMNAAGGVPVVEATTGGAGGGGAALTDRGRQSIRVYQKLMEAMRNAVEDFRGEATGSPINGV